jgi:putative transposase
MVTPAARRCGVEWLTTERRVTSRRACRLMGLARSTWGYRFKRAEPEGLRQAIRDVAYAHPRLGYRFVHWNVVKQGFGVGQRRVRRLYRLEGLHVRKRRRRRLKLAARVPLCAATRINERWSLDFVHDQLASGRTIRVLTVIDDYSRESVALEVGTSLPAAIVTRALDRAIERRGACPRSLRCDNGSEFTSMVFLQWAARHGIDVQFIEPGKPTQNAYIESFNGRLRDECLNTNWFPTLEAARAVIAEWQHHYNYDRPHGALGRTPPTIFAASPAAG